MNQRGFRGALVRIVSEGPAEGAKGILVAALLLVLIGLIGWIDYTTGSGITFVAVYVVPVVAGSVFCNTRVAMIVAAAASIVWSISTTYTTGDGLLQWKFPANSVLRFLILSLIVLLLSALRDALFEARRSEQRSQDFLAFAAHQLRTPTAAASAAAQTLLARGGTPDDEEQLVRIAHETSRAGKLVAAILQFLRMDHTRELPRTTVDLDSVCQEAIDRSRGVSAIVDVHTSVDSRQPPTVEANSDALIEAVCCLLDNARRHARTTVTVKTAVHNGTAELAVADDGPGLPPGQQEQAFAPFVSIDGHGGTGLGLAIARGLVEGQRGTLTYDDGAFVIRVPLSRNGAR